MPKGVTDRPADVWEPLLAVADAAGGDWPQRARAACLELIGNASSTSSASLGVRLLGDLRAVFGDVDRRHTDDLVARLVDLEESPWADLRGKPLDARGLSRRLSTYGVHPTQVKVDGVNRRGYRREDLHDPWSRYLPAETATTATSATPHVTEPESVALSESVALASATSNLTATDPPTLTCTVTRVAQVANLREKTRPRPLLCSTHTGSPAPSLISGSRRERGYLRLVLRVDRSQQPRLAGFCCASCRDGDRLQRQARRDRNKAKAMPSTPC